MSIITNDQYQIQTDFKSTYWSALKMYVFINDIYIHELVHFEYQILENVIPLAGYASTKVQSFEEGLRIVQGKFAINFTTNWYMYDVINHARKLSTPTKEQPGPNPPPPPKAAPKQSSSPQSSYFKAVKAASEANAATAVRPHTRDGSAVSGYTRVTTPEQGLPDPTKPRESFYVPGLTLTLRFGMVGNGLILVPKYNRNYNVSSYSLKDSDSEGLGTGVKFTDFRIIGNSLGTNDQGMPILEVYNFVATDAIPLRNLAYQPKLEQQTARKFLVTQ